VTVSRLVTVGSRIEVFASLYNPLDFLVDQAIVPSDLALGKPDPE
jgi:hypothetical protein